MEKEVEIPEFVRKEMIEAASKIAHELAPIYKFLNWKWAIGPETTVVPSETKIAYNIRNKIRELKKIEAGQNYMYCESGGIKVSVTKWNHSPDTWHWHIEFVPIYRKGDVRGWKE